MRDKEKIIINDYIQGDPLSEENLDKTLNFLHKIRLLLPTKTIWLYTGYDFNHIMHWTQEQYDVDVHNNFRLTNTEYLRQQIISMCDVLVDGRYIDSQKDISLRWRGSKNQRVIDLNKTLQQDEIILYCN